MVERTDSPDSKTSPNIVIIGQGAIGLLWYANFYLNNVTANNNNTGNNDKTSHLNISLLSSNDAFKTLRSFDYKSYDGIANEIPLRHANTAHLSSADIILLCVKSYQVANAYQQYQLHGLPNAHIVLCHNGLGTLEDINELQLTNSAAKVHLPILAMTLTHGAKLTMHDNGRPQVEHTGKGFVDIGGMQGELSNQQQHQLSTIFSQGLATKWRNDLTKRLWLKLAINAVINPLTAINNIDNGAINNEEFAVISEQVLQELILIAGKNNLSFELAELKSLVKEVAEKTAKNCSSMRADILANKPTEIDYINGFIVRSAQLHNIECPANQRLTEQVKSFQR